MIEYIFTVDYEIFGNGEGSLREFVHEPAASLKEIFREWNAKFVLFVEAAELEMIEDARTDDASCSVKQQIRDFYREGFEIGLHIHPWWYNAHYKNGKWILDYSEYNLCTLPKDKIINIVNRSISYLQRVLDEADFAPLSFRAGHLLFQPSTALAKVLVDRGIKVDSSVYKGGLWHQHNLDYRPALLNGNYWMFESDINRSEPQGKLIEIPIYTRMVPIWKMFTSNRVSMQQQGLSATKKSKKIIKRLKDILRFRYPQKFDLGQMNMKEILHMTEKIIQEDQKDPTSIRPVVIILHTKDRINMEIVHSLLTYLKRKGIAVSDFKEAYRKIKIKSSNFHQEGNPYEASHPRF